jgi:hypothetical protein
MLAALPRPAKGVSLGDYGTGGVYGYQQQSGAPYSRQEAFFQVPEL